MKILMTFLLLLVVSCAGSRSYRECKRTHVVNTQKFWDKQLKKRTLLQRIGAPDSKILEFIQLSNKVDGIPLVPRSYELSKKEKAMVVEVINRLPKKLKGIFNRDVLGVYFVSDLGSSALTDTPKELKNKGILVFDKKVLQLKGNDWCSWKESSPFEKGEYKLNCKISSKKKDTEQRAFEYIFLHEFAHILTLNSKNIAFIPAGTKRDKIKSFESVSWKLNNTKEYFVKNSQNFTWNMKYYLEKPSISNKDMLKSYQQLTKSKLPSMYGTINVWDDFAESFVIYYHAKILKRPWLISIEKEEKVIFNFKSCIITGKCPKKIKLIKDEFF